MRLFYSVTQHRASTRCKSGFNRHYVGKNIPSGSSCTEKLFPPFSRAIDDIVQISARKTRLAP